jgi:hypothetical protein
MLSRIPIGNIFRCMVTFDVPMQGDSLVDRLGAVCDVVERAFPGEKLCLALSYNEPGAHIPVKDRRKYFAQRGRTKLHWFQLHNGKSIRGWRDGRKLDEGRVALGGRIFRHDLGLLSMGVDFPDAPWTLFEQLLVEIGDVASAFHAAVVPDGNEVLRATQFDTRTAQPDPTLIERGIPRLKDFTYGGPAVAAQPMYLGWLNYWSAETCAFLGFPDEDQHAALMPLSYKTPAGAWVVKLTAEPLDIRRSEHVDALAKAYRLLPRIGLRLQ